MVKGVAQTKKVDISKSKITWVGKKVTGQHEGIVKLKDGYLVFKNKKIAGGKFTVDMTITVTIRIKLENPKQNWKAI